jgi:hypothetical protein
MLRHRIDNLLRRHLLDPERLDELQVRRRLGVRLGVPIQKPELPAHGRVAVLEASPSNGSTDRPLTTGLRPVGPDAPVAPPVADRLAPFRR